MKHLFLMALTCLTISLSAQGNSGRGFPFQGIARDNNGNILKSTNLDFKIGLLATNASVADYEETHSLTTDPYGVFSVVIGTGTQSSVANGITEFKDVNFRVGQYWVKVEIKEGEQWVELTTQKLLSVPYAENSFIMPLGTVITYGGSLESAQNLEAEGWLICDGRTVSKDEFGSLFAVMGSAWGDDGANFRLPDMRGVFLRGLDQRTTDSQDPDGNNRLSLYAGGNTGRNVGSYQADAFQGHKHFNRNLVYPGSKDLPNTPDQRPNQRSVGSTAGVYNAGFGTPRVSTETRAKNVNVIYLIKAK